VATVKFADKEVPRGEKESLYGEGSRKSAVGQSDRGKVQNRVAVESSKGE